MTYQAILDKYRGREREREKDTQSELECAWCTLWQIVYKLSKATLTHHFARSVNSAVDRYMKTFLVQLCTYAKQFAEALSP